VKVAAYQAPLLAAGSMEALRLIRKQIDLCEGCGVEILCCPEGILGGLADYAHRPASIAIDVEGGSLSRVLAPLSSDTVTTILGFTEIDRQGRLYNAAAVFHRGSVVGVYRKRHPAINTSVYAAGDTAPVFTVGALTFGVIICRDSIFEDPARSMASQGAKALFIPTNNGLPVARAHADLAATARSADVARATQNDVSVVRADVAGQTAALVSWGSSGIVDRAGRVLVSAMRLQSALLIADIETAPARRCPSDGASAHPGEDARQARRLIQPSMSR
jgi:5-aminopentanamidase